MKAVFVGNKATYDFLLAAKPDWDWQVPVINIDDRRDNNGNVILDQQGKPAFPGFWSLADAGVIDDMTNIIVISDEFYQSAMQNWNSRPDQSRKLRNDFLELVFASTQSSLTLIVNYFGANRNRIEADLLKYSGAQSNGTLQKYYWVNPQSPLPDIDSAIKQYINSPDADPANVDEIAAAEHLNVMATPEEDSQQQAISGWQDSQDYEEEQFTNNYGKKAQIICCTSSKGGVGKTTTTFGIGAWLSASSKEAARQGLIPKPLKICIVDLDVHDAQIGSMIGKAEPTILRVAIEPQITQEVMSKNLCYSERMKCWFLLSPKLPGSADTIPISKFEESIDVLRYMFDVIILDTSVDYTDELFAKVAYPKANKIVFITTLDRKAVIGMGKWIIRNGLPAPEGAQIPLDKVCVAINMGMKDVNMSLKEIRTIIDMSVSKVYAKLDRTIDPSDWKRPQIVGAIPEIPNGLITRMSNIQQFELTLNIPQFEKSISQISRAVMPRAFKEKLPNVHRQ